MEGKINKIHVMIFQMNKVDPQIYWNYVLCGMGGI